MQPRGETRCPHRPYTGPPRESSFWGGKGLHISAAWGRLGPAFPGAAKARPSICSSPRGKSRVATALLQAGWQRSFLQAGPSNGSVPATSERFFSRINWFSTEPDGFLSQTPACLPPPPLLPGFDLGTSTPKPIAEPWSFLLLGWEAGARQPKQRREKSPHSGGGGGGEKMASFPSRSLQDYAKPLNVGLHALSSGARPLTALFWGGWRAQRARLPP